MRYFGLDIHKLMIQICQIDSTGKERRDWKIPATRESISEFAKSLTSDDAAVMETTFHTWEIYQILATSRAKIVVSDSNKVKAIAHARIKTDKIDAHILAQLLRTDFIPTVEMPTEEHWNGRQLMKHRQLLVRQQTRFKNSILGILNKKLIKSPYSRELTPSGKKWLRNLALPPTEKLMMNQLLDLVETVERQLKEVVTELEARAKVGRTAMLLMSIPGVGLATASALTAAIGDINRFQSPNQLASYLGLVPTLSQSGERARHGGITKAGNSLCRFLIIEAASAMAKGSAPLAVTYHKIKAKKCHSVAVTALARKMSVLIWHMLKNNEPYRYSTVYRTRLKLRKVEHGLLCSSGPSTTRMTLEEVYAEANLPPMMEAKPAEVLIQAHIAKQRASQRKIAISRQ